MVHRPLRGQGAEGSSRKTKPQPQTSRAGRESAGHWGGKPSALREEYLSTGSTSYASLCFPLAVGKAPKARLGLNNEHVSDDCASTQEPSHMHGCPTHHAGTQTPIYTHVLYVYLNRHACTSHVCTSDLSYLHIPTCCINMHTNMFTCIM